MRVLDLFSGIGGFSLGLERAGMETVAFCEIDPFCQKVLKKHWPDVPCYTDITKLTAEQLENDGIKPDVIVGGYPCQPFSHAGKREGAEDDRHLWPEMFRLIKTCKPRWIIAENVAGHISMGLDQVLSDLEAIGYSWWAFVIPACAKDAHHRRDRVWILANPIDSADNTNGRAQGETESVQEQYRQTGRTRMPSGTSGSASYVANPKNMQRDGSNDNTREQLGRKQVSESGDSGRQGDVANPMCESVEGDGTRGQQEPTVRQQDKQAEGGQQTIRGWSNWPTEPAICRVANGVPNRVDRLKSLGNSVVPQVVEQIGRAIMEAEL